MATTFNVRVNGDKEVTITLAALLPDIEVKGDNPAAVTLVKETLNNVYYGLNGLCPAYVFGGTVEEFLKTIFANLENTSRSFFAIKENNRISADTDSIIWHMFMKVKPEFLVHHLSRVSGVEVVFSRDLFWIREKNHSYCYFVHYPSELTQEKLTSLFGDDAVTFDGVHSLWHVTINREVSHVDILKRLRDGFNQVG